MQIDIKGRNVPVTDEMRARTARRLEEDLAPSLATGSS